MKQTKKWKLKKTVPISRLKFSSEKCFRKQIRIRIITLKVARNRHLYVLPQRDDRKSINSNIRENEYVENTF